MHLGPPSYPYPALGLWWCWVESHSLGVCMSWLLWRLCSALQRQTPAGRRRYIFEALCLLTLHNFALRQETPLLVVVQDGPSMEIQQLEPGGRSEGASSKRKRGEKKGDSRKRSERAPEAKVKACSHWPSRMGDSGCEPCVVDLLIGHDWHWAMFSSIEQGTKSPHVPRQSFLCTDLAGGSGY